MTEEWRFITHDGKPCFVYQVSNLGRVKSLRDGVDRVLKTRPNSWGYEIVNLKIAGCYKTKQVHRLVAEAFYGWREPKWHVNHIDGDKLNNRLDKLEWATPRENTAHAKSKGLLGKSAGHLSKREIRAIRSLAFEHNMPYQQIADVFGISRRSVARTMAKKETDTRREA